ncbi:uncharacterized protein CPUR_05598 [Claviceps purpurea 20.1]|uniref:Uncharacterized protein n=1 Tax=Claviceps purpurea (strain 20.1) TaxID=1111077 RepID=M1WCP6_CLAP2|nr:uncharacterized protein CPUR_05598 [Claviceps purpurea 20.1]
MDTGMGSLLLGQIEEVSLEELLTQLRSSINASAIPSRLKQTHIPPLDALAATHLRDTQSPTISLYGRSLPLLYKIVATLISPPHSKAVFVLDLEGRFDAASLDCEDADLAHVYVQHPARSTPEHLRGLIANAEAFMLYDEDAQRSRHREWWGTLVVGGLAAGDVTAGWKGWLRVERGSVPGFALGMGVEDAWRQRERRDRAVEDKGWVASSEWGGFEFDVGGRDRANQKP